MTSTEAFTLLGELFVAATAFVGVVRGLVLPLALKMASKTATLHDDHVLHVVQVAVDWVAGALAFVARLPGVRHMSAVPPAPPKV